MAADALGEPVRVALAGVLDPCSRFIGSNLTFSELGMIDSVETSDEGDVAITLLLDDPTCLYIVEIERAMRLAVSSVPGVRNVSVSIRWDELWTEERATEQARRRLRRNLPPHAPKPLVPLKTLRTREDG